MLDYQFSEGAPLVEGDATQLRQVVMNLILNAAEAMSGTGGVVRMRVAPREVDAGYLGGCVLGADNAPGQYLALEVRDTGSGMDEATVRRLFEPFFTTKFTGRGLGMAAVHGIVRAHHGAIQIASIPGKGTTITVLLPLAATPLSPAPAFSAVVPAPPADPPQTILVIDDEPEVRRVTARMLERIGYRAVTAINGEAGLALLDTDPTIAGVLLDLTMPGLGGEETFQQLRQRRPALPVIVVSGYSEQEVLSYFDAAEAIDVMQKPFTPATLHEVLARTLAPRR